MIPKPPPSSALGPPEPPVSVRFSNRMAPVALRTTTTGPGPLLPALITVPATPRMVIERAVPTMVSLSGYSCA